MKVVSNKDLLAEMVRIRKDMSKLELLMTTAISNQHKIMRFIDPPRKLEVREDKTFEETWGFNLAEEKDKSEEQKLVEGVLKNLADIQIATSKLQNLNK